MVRSVPFSRADSVTTSQARSDAFAVFSGDKVFRSHVDMLPEALREAMHARGLADSGILASYPRTSIHQLGLVFGTGISSSSTIPSTISSSLSPSLYSSGQTELEQSGEVSSTINQASLEIKGDVGAASDFKGSGGNVVEGTQFESESVLSVFPVVPMEVSKISCDDAVSEPVLSTRF